MDFLLLPSRLNHLLFIPTKAGIQKALPKGWITVFAGMKITGRMLKNRSIQVEVLSKPSPSPYDDRFGIGPWRSILEIAQFYIDTKNLISYIAGVNKEGPSNNEIKSFNRRLLPWLRLQRGNKGDLREDHPIINE